MLRPRPVCCMPNGTSNAGCMPDGTSNAGCMPDGTSNASCMPDGTSNAGCMPDGTSYAGCMPDGTSNAGCMPDGTSNAGCMPNGTSNAGCMPNGTSYAGCIPVACPRLCKQGVPRCARARCTWGLKAARARSRGRLGPRRAAPILDKDEPASNDCVALRQGRVLCYDQGRFAAYQLVRLRLAACQWHVLGLLHAKGTS